MEKKLKELAKGSGRIVYEITPEKVAKVARNERGRVQNKQEYQMWNKADERTKNILAKIFSGNTKTWDWIKMEFCRRANPDDFKVKFGIPYDEFKAILQYWYKKRYHGKEARSIRPKYGKYKDSFWLKPLKKMIESEPYSIIDFMKLTSWGINSDDRLVLIDFGLSLEIYRKYYKKVKK